MTGTGPLTGRLVLLALLCVVVQIVAVSQIDLLGTNADLLPLTVAAVGLLCGPVPGAVFGFSVGLLLDAALVQTLGLTSLVAVVVGYAAGRLSDRTDDRGPLLALAIGAGATTVAVCGFGVLQFLLGVDSPVSFQLLRQLLATILVNTLIAVPVFAFVRRVLGATVPADRRTRRRRVYAASLSPLHRAP